MLFLLIGFIIGGLGLVPLFASLLTTGERRTYDYGPETAQKWKKVISLSAFFSVSLISWLFCWLSPPALYEPWWGGPGMVIVILWIVSTIIVAALELKIWPRVAYLMLALILAVFLSFIFRGSEMFNADQYSKLIGPIEERVWTQDIQPKSPEHIRTNSVENALYMAKQALGQFGAIGSQFQISEKEITLQKINDRFWYVVPLDHVGWSTWRHTLKVPMYIRVSAEDPNLPAELVKFPDGQELYYTPEACFSNNLSRHLWTHGYANTGLMDFTPEVDDNGKFWYVVTTFEYAVNGWDGKRVTGVLIVDPVTGDIKQEPVGKIEKWADRVMPAEIVQQNLSYKGVYPKGDYWNSVAFLGIGAQENLTSPEQTNMVYGSDGELYWVTGMTSKSDKDTSLVGLYYINTHSGKVIHYKAEGSTDSAILAAINKNPEVQYKHLHGVAPQIYNVSGVMTALVPMLNENNAYQGFGFVDVKNLQVAMYGANQLDAYEKYQSALAQSGHQIAPDKSLVKSRFDGIVDRFIAETQSGNTSFYFHVQGLPHEFRAETTLSPKMRLTKSGDHVIGSFIANGQDVQAVREFDNLSLPLVATSAQQAVRAEAVADVQKVESHEQAATIRENLNHLSDDELINLQKKKKGSGSK